jgi:hypothetical protein
VGIPPAHLECAHEVLVPDLLRARPARRGTCRLLGQAWSLPYF